MLSKIRKVLAALSFSLVTLLFLDFTGVVHGYFSWLAKIQLIPAILALNLVVIVVLLLLTIVFGRLYCSVICPLGIFQDLIARVAKRGKKRPYSYSVAKTMLRYVMLALFVVALLAGVSVAVSILDPYAAYGRMANNLLQPLWIVGNNIFAHISERFDSYAFYSVDLWMRSVWTVSVSVVTLGVVGWLAWRNGRIYCNTICPVGTLLGFVSRISLFKVRIDEEKCNKCGLCASNCKSSCIDVKSYNVDSSRCVDCLNCIDKCAKGAISYSTKRNTSSPTESMQEKGAQRREFILTSAILTTAVIKAQAQKKKGAKALSKVVEMKMDGGLADILDKESPERKTPITPPGSYSARNMKSHCTACQLCVSACPNGVLKPSTSLDNFMQPTVSFVDGYCRIECTRCGEVCPAGAIKPISVADKTSVQIGHAVWSMDRCLVIKDDISCSNCARQCPVQAIHMVDGGYNHPIPHVDTQRCIGCGACEHLCPSRPISAIHVEGHNMHKII